MICPATCPVIRRFCGRVLSGPHHLVVSGRRRLGVRMYSLESGPVSPSESKMYGMLKSRFRTGSSRPMPESQTTDSRSKFWYSWPTQPASAQLCVVIRSRTLAASATNLKLLNDALWGKFGDAGQHLRPFFLARRGNQLALVSTLRVRKEPRELSATAASGRAINCGCGCTPDRGAPAR